MLPLRLYVERLTVTKSRKLAGPASLANIFLLTVVRGDLGDQYALIVPHKAWTFP